MLLNIQKKRGNSTEIDICLGNDFLKISTQISL